MNFKSRLILLRQTIQKEIDTCDEPQRCSYLRTKQFGYEQINPFFNGTQVLELGSDGTATSSILVRWSDNLTIVDKANKFSVQLEQDEALKQATFIQSTWEDYKPQVKFSDILLTDSLEHVQNPIKLLSLISNWLDDQGRIHIIVPNANSLHRLLGVEMGILKMPGTLNQHDIDSEHLRVYNRERLKHDTRQAGLEILKLEGVQLKPMTDTQLANFPIEYVRALNNLSPLFNEYCAEIYACCIKVASD